MSVPEAMTGEGWAGETGCGPDLLPHEDACLHAASALDLEGGLSPFAGPATSPDPGQALFC